MKMTVQRLNPATGTYSTVEVDASLDAETLEAAGLSRAQLDSVVRYLFARLRRAEIALRLVDPDVLAAAESKLRLE